MKTLIFIVTGLIASIAIAQPKYTSVYSTSNYKMPLHAKVAKDNNLDKLQTFNHSSEAAVGNQSSANYKNSFAKANTNGGVMPILPIEIVVNPTMASGNYKSSFKGTTKSVKVEQIPVQQPVVYAPLKEDSTNE